MLLVLQTFISMVASANTQYILRCLKLFTLQANGVELFASLSFSFGLRAMKLKVDIADDQVLNLDGGQTIKVPTDVRIEFIR